MSTTYNLAPLPRQRYYYPYGGGYGDLAGRPLAGGKIYTYSSKNHATPKATYQDPDGLAPHTNPIILDINGEAAIYWQFDDENPDDLYYIEIYDPNSSPPTGTPIYTADKYDGAPLPTSASSTSPGDYNYIRNAQFAFPWFKQLYNLKDAVSPIPTILGSWAGAQWFFSKNNNTIEETIEYVPFDIGQDEVPYNPMNYVSWNVVAGDTGAGETFKIFSQPLSWDLDFPQSQVIPPSDNMVNLLSDQDVRISIWARSATSETLTINFRQHFGTGGSPTPDRPLQILSVDLTPTWTYYTATFHITKVEGLDTGTTPGWCQVEVALPLNQGSGTNIDFANIQLTAGLQEYAFQYRTPAFEKSLFDDWFQATSGEMKPMLGSKDGWISLENNFSIGNFTSGATFSAEYSYALYAFVWNNIADTYAPVSTGRGANALEDFDAGKTISFPVTDDSVFGNVGTGSFNVGEHVGETTHTQTAAELANHLHASSPLGISSSVPNVTSGGSVEIPTNPGAFSITQESTTGFISGVTPGQPFNIMQPTTFFNWYIKI